MLQAKTEEQKKRVLEIFGIQESCCHFPLDFDKETDWGYEDCNDRIYLDGNITFDKMRDATKYRDIAFKPIFSPVERFSLCWWIVVRVG